MLLIFIGLPYIKNLGENALEVAFHNLIFFIS